MRRLTRRAVSGFAVQMGFRMAITSASVIRSTERLPIFGMAYLLSAFNHVVSVSRLFQVGLSDAWVLAAASLKSGALDDDPLDPRLPARGLHAEVQGLRRYLVVLYGKV
jgi:thiosulfate reductase cytochrome b subunit